MPVKTSALHFSNPLALSGSWRSRTLALLLMIVIAGVFCVDSRYPTPLRRYHSGTQVKASGSLTFGTVYQVNGSQPLEAQNWRTTVNRLDANRFGMTFSFLFAPAALAFLATLPRRRRPCLRNRDRANYSISVLTSSCFGPRTIASFLVLASWTSVMVFVSLPVC